MRLVAVGNDWTYTKTFYYVNKFMYIYNLTRIRLNAGRAVNVFHLLIFLRCTPDIWPSDVSWSQCCLV